MKTDIARMNVLFGPFEMQNFHTHIGFEINYVAEGNVIYYVEDKKTRLNKHDVLILNTKKPHRVVIEHGAKLQSIEVNDALLGDSSHTYTLNAFMCQVLRDIISAINNKKSDAYIISAVTYFMEYCKHANLTSYLQATIDYIEDNYKYIHSVETVARQVNISMSHLQKRFREDTGITLWNYINEVKLKQAIFLLQNTDLPIGEIDAHVGINSRQTFYKLFVQKEGISPAAYRKRFTEHPLSVIL